MKFRYIHPKPGRDQLAGLSPSELKTVLRRRGFRVPRCWLKYGAVAYRGNRCFRFRYWAGAGEFFVDISCPVTEFDRWANSVDRTINFFNFLEIYPVRGRREHC